MYGGNIIYTGVAGYEVEYKDKPFSGELLINEKFTKKSLNIYGSDIKIINNGIIITKYVYKPGGIERMSAKFKNIFRSSEEDIFFEEPEKLVHYYYNFEKGRLHGNQQASTINDKLIYNLNFVNGASHSSQNYFDPLNYGSQNILIRRFYDSGLLHGYLTSVDKYNKPAFIANYTKGKLDGNYVKFDPDGDRYDNPMPNVEANFHNDTLYGNVIIYKYGEELERIPFVHGKVTGWYFKNNIRKIDAKFSDSIHDFEPYLKVYRELKVKFKDGRVVDTMLGYFDNGNVKYTAIADKDWGNESLSQVFLDDFPVIFKSVSPFNDSLLEEELDYSVEFFKDYSSPEIISFSPGELNAVSQSGIDFDPLNEKVKARFTFYYKNGVKSQEGSMVNNVKYRIWKYYGESGTLMKEIEYKPGVDSASGVKVWYKGKITGYYPSGKKMSEGLITDQNLSYQCSQEIQVAYEEVYYTSFLNETGKELLKNNSGPVTDYHLNGNKHFSGSVTYGERTGFWKFYDPAGHLTGIGEYADGRKHGKWLTGDLGGLNFIDNACSVNEALSLIKERQARDIDVTETIFDMGIIISSSHLILEKF